MRSATYLRSYRGKQSVITVGKAMTSQQGGGWQPTGIRNFSNPFFLEVADRSRTGRVRRRATLLLLDSHYSAEREHP